MRKNLILMGRYTLLMFIAWAFGVGVCSIAQMPGCAIRAGGIVGGGWLCLRWLVWRVSQIEN